jgi:hypothetical protein
MQIPVSNLDKVTISDVKVKEVQKKFDFYLEDLDKKLEKVVSN